MADEKHDGGRVIPDSVAPYLETMYTIARIYDVANEYLKSVPLTRRQRFRIWRSNVRWWFHDRFFSDCRAYDDDD